VKILVILLTLLLPVQAWSAVYYMSTSGDDANDRTSPATPWRSILKLNLTPFAPGDSILFKRGDIWDGANAAPIIPATSGSAGNPITWGAYGTGPNPVITFASRRNSTSDWTDEGGNIWSTGGITLTGPEIFPNPDFSADSGGWFGKCAGGASCSFIGRTTSEGEYYSPPAGYKVVVDDQGSYADNIELYTASDSPLSFTQGKYYQITFLAKSTVPFTIPDILLTSDGSDITSGMYVKALKVGTEWSVCTLIFRADRSTSTAEFEMLLGGGSGIPNGAAFYVDIFSCKEITDQDFFGMYYSANLIFNYSSGSPTTGKLVPSGAIANQGDWYQSYQDRKIYLYSTSNPAAFYNGDIIVVNGSLKSGFWIIGKSYHTVENLDFFAITSGWYGQDFTDNTIQHCNAYYTGGNPVLDSHDYSWGKGLVIARQGEAVGAAGNISNWTVRYNNFSQAYDCNVTWQNSANNKTADGIWVYYNVLGLAHYNIEFWWRGTGSSMSNVYIYNNTMYDAGSEWSADQRPDEPVQLQDAHIKCWDSPSNGTNINIKNNIMDGAKTQLLYFAVWSQWASRLAADNNLYYNQPDHFGRTTGVYYDTLGAWQAITNTDAASLYADPRFVSPSTLDFHIGASSPARAAGVGVGLTTDFAGNPVDAHNPDIGAYEYEAAAGKGGGCSLGAGQNAPTTFADTATLLLPLLPSVLMRRKRKKSGIWNPMDNSEASSKKGSRREVRREGPFPQ
jgi:hypothetical protein